MGLRAALLATLLLALTSAAAPAQACMAVAPLEPADIKYADVVVIGRIANYTIVLDQAWREEMKKRAQEPGISPELKEFYLTDRGFLTDYAKFDVLVDEVLVGKAPEALTVTWDNSTFSEPESMPSGPFLIALTDPRKGLMLPLRGPSATIMPNPEPAALTVLQAPCSDAFIFETTSEEARASLRILGR
ncbi:hypothetical protein [Dongia sp.]|uniref:hypothetical protein n=1 Tax=Dongia sp. TaxID=1977262 RepID=UPI003753D354